MDRMARSRQVGIVANGVMGHFTFIVPCIYIKEKAAIFSDCRFPAIEPFKRKSFFMKVY